MTGVEGNDFKMGFSIDFDIPLVQSHNIQWHFTNLSNMTIVILENSTSISSRYVFSDNFHNLTISNVKLRDRGRYTLTATNEAGTRSSTLYLNVNGKYNSIMIALSTINLFLVESKLLDQTGDYVLANTSQTHQFNCSANGIPRPNILWQRNGLLLFNTSRVSIVEYTVHESTSTDNVLRVNSVLTINNLRETDSGSYICLADNSFGVADALNVPYTLNVTFCKCCS